MEKADSDIFEGSTFDHDSHPCDFSFSGVHGSPCPEDSVASEDGGCKCVAPCPTDKCRPDQRPFPVRAADPETPGSCCPLYKCLPSGNYANSKQYETKSIMQTNELFHCKTSAQAGPKSISNFTYELTTD